MQPREAAELDELLAPLMVPAYRLAFGMLRDREEAEGHVQVVPQHEAMVLRHCCEPRPERSAWPMDQPGAGWPARLKLTNTPPTDKSEFYEAYGSACACVGYWEHLVQVRLTYCSYFVQCDEQSRSIRRTRARRPFAGPPCRYAESWLAEL